jgi:hypothetical protein
MRIIRAAAAAVIVATVAAGCGNDSTIDDPGEAPGGDPAGAWRRLPDAPLTPRDHAVVIGVDDRVLVVGGWKFLCPPNADCAAPSSPPLTDGAVYDPATDSWTATTPAPFGMIRQEYATVAIGETAWLLIDCDGGPMCEGRPRLVSYDVDADRWTDHGTVPGPKAYRHLVAVGRTLLAYSATDEYGERPDLVFDPSSSTWTELPDDPLPGTYDRFIVPAGDQLVLTGSSIAALDGGQDETKLAARLDPHTGAWTRLPDAPGQGYQLMPTGRGPLLNGHFIDSPGWVLDPDTWTWSVLPDRNGEQTNLSGVLERDRAVYDIPNSVGQMASSNALVIYDIATKAYVTIPTPPGREDVYDDSSTALGRDLFVYGGQRWTGDQVDGDGKGELVGDAWLWTAPVS